MIEMTGCMSGFRTLKDAQAFGKMLANPDKYTIVEIIEGNLLSVGARIAYIVVNKKWFDEVPG